VGVLLAEALSEVEQVDQQGDVVGVQGRVHRCVGEGLPQEGLLSREGNAVVEAV
jgi:hypothetical protein